MNYRCKMKKVFLPEIFDFSLEERDKENEKNDSKPTLAIKRVLNENKISIVIVNK